MTQEQLCDGFVVKRDFHVIVDHFDISPLLKLRKLEYLDLPAIAQSDRDRLLSALPKLRYGNVAKPHGE